MSPGWARRRTHVLGLLPGWALVVLIALTTVPTAAAAAEPTPRLSQSIDADQPIATGRAELVAGHIDLGPRYVDDQWTLMIHDGTQAQPVWRDPDETVLRVSDAALQPVPDDPAYAFLGVDAGKQVYVVPQVQHPDVVWLGWNTQDPRVMRSIDRGVTLSLLGVAGPGTVTTYLQSGNFSAPEPLWRSVEPTAQPFWAEVNTHTHANWVFTEPGVYVIAVQVSADLISGETVSATRALRFAVGDATSVNEAYAAEIPGSVEQASPVSDRAGAAKATDEPGTLLLAVLVALAVLLATGLVLLLLRGRRVKRQAERVGGTALSGGDR